MAAGTNCCLIRLMNSPVRRGCLAIADTPPCALLSEACRWRTLVLAVSLSQLGGSLAAWDYSAFLGVHTTVKRNTSSRARKKVCQICHREARLTYRDCGTIKKVRPPPEERGGRARTRSGDGRVGTLTGGRVASFCLLLSATWLWRRRGGCRRARPTRSGRSATVASQSGSSSPTRAGSAPPGCRGCTRPCRSSPSARRGPRP